MIRGLLLLLAFPALAPCLPAQTVMAPGDSAYVLYYEEFMEQLMSWHPVARQAVLAGRRGDALLRKARGQFDPYLYGAYAGKQYSGSSYYQKMEAGLKLPTWFGVQGFVGYQHNSGSYLNPADNLPDAGLLQAGIEFNLGRGLLMDQRRREVLKGQWYPAISETERRVMVNALAFDAAAAYWEWWLSWHRVEVYREAVRLAAIRFQGVKASYAMGDEPAIDTLESLIQLQTRQFGLNEARLKYAEAAFLLSNFLWDESGEPLLLKDGVVPPRPAPVRRPGLVDSLPPVEEMLAAHPELLAISYKRRQLEIDRRWAAEQLKPELSVKAGTLIQPGAGGDRSGFYEDHTLGLQLSFPLLIRKARGELALSNLEIMDTEIKLAQKEFALRNKIGALLVKISNTKSQIDLYTGTVENYVDLLDAEVRKFEIGESSLFLINAREQNLISARLSLLQLQASLPALYAELFEATGGYFDLY